MSRDSYLETKDFIKRFNIVEFRTKQSPISKEELSMLRIQIDAAKFIASEVSALCQQDPNLDKLKISEAILKNWNANIKNFVKLLLSDSY